MKCQITAWLVNKERLIFILLINILYLVIEQKMKQARTANVTEKVDYAHHFK